MAVLPFSPERRGKRSSETYRAINFQLEHLFRMHGLRNFTLSDANGMILAHAGFLEESEAVAAYAPVLAKCTDRERRAQVIDKIGGHIPFDYSESLVEVRSFFVDGERLFLGVVGEGSAAVETAIYRALTGIRRIYKQSWN